MIQPDLACTDFAKLLQFYTMILSRVPARLLVGAAADLPGGCRLPGGWFGCGSRRL